MPKNTPSWLSTYFEGYWTRYCRKKARDIFAAHPDIDPYELAQDAQSILYEKLWKFGKSLATPLVRTMCRNLLLDLYREHFGRHRPPQWVTKLGPLWVRLWELVCLQRLPKHEVIHQMTTSTPPVDAAWVVAGITQLNAHQACPQKVTLISMDTDTDTDDSDASEPMDFVDVNIPDTGDQVAAAEITILIGVLAGFSTSAALSAYSQRFIEIIQAVSADLALTDEERLMLRLRFQEDQTIADTAKLLAKKHHQVKYDLEQLLKRIRQVLEKHELGIETLLTPNKP